MKWMRLKVILIPLIMQEVDNVTEKYISMFYLNVRPDKSIQNRR